MKKLLMAAAIVAAAGTPALALGPVDIDLGVVYWVSETEDDTEAVDSEAPGGFVDLGFGDHWVVGASYYKADPDGGEGIDFTNVSVKYKFISASRNNFFALGAGVEQLGIADDSSTSARVFAEGRVSVKIVYFYARAAYLPALGDIDTGVGTFKGDTGTDFDAGIGIKPLPFFYIYAGYTDKTRTFELPLAGDVDLKVKGPYAGVGFNF
ncbi:MAG TPA: hypothetical protein VF139_01690 [Candidatus Polarisedimenticolaceae bacterium]